MRRVASEGCECWWFDSTMTTRTPLFGVSQFRAAAILHQKYFMGSAICGCCKVETLRWDLSMEGTTSRLCAREMKSSQRILKNKIKNHQIASSRHWIHLFCQFYDLHRITWVYTTHWFHRMVFAARRLLLCVFCLQSFSVGVEIWFAFFVMLTKCARWHIVRCIVWTHFHRWTHVFGTAFRNVVRQATLRQPMGRIERTSDPIAAHFCNEFRSTLWN